MTSHEPLLNLNGTSYSLAQLKTGSFKNNLNPFEQSTLKFCHQWLTGQSEFSLQTSGSTGTPKSITITRTQMETSALLTIKALKLKSGDTALVCLDTKYIAGQMMLVRAMVLGMNIVGVDPSANPFDTIPQNQVIDFAAFVPYQVQNIFNSSSSSRLNNLKCAIIGGAPVDSGTMQKIRNTKCEFYATYGMTETFSHIALQRLNGGQSQQYFEVLEGIQIEKDERGCLAIRADYLGHKKIVTNDLIELISANKFRWLGRWDNVINSGGVKVSPEKVEQSVQEIFDSFNITSRFFVTGLPDKKLNFKIALVVEGQPFEDELQIKIVQTLEKMDRFERPRALKFVLNFKQTETGKILRKETVDLIPASLMTER